MNYTSDSSTERTQKLAGHFEQKYQVECLPVQADLGTVDGPGRLIDAAKATFAYRGSKELRIDIIVNNAAVASKSKIEDCTCEEFDRLYRVNVRGPLLLMKAALPYLPNDRSGRVVNVSSVSSSLGFEEDCMYGGTKAALEAMTRTWARELNERCTVNAVNPGPVDTEMYAGTSKEFQMKMSSWTKNAPLAAIRPRIDKKELVENAEFAGGRPVSNDSMHLFIFTHFPRRLIKLGNRHTTQTLPGL
jgi:NAD(P)-dependent dehydrogenase (short-subunit alcohol dehydrogenase family)